MSRQKIKVEETTEVYVARSKLDGVLQTLVDQKEESATPEKDLLNQPDSDSELFDSPLSSPAKKSPRVGRLQRKRKMIKEEPSPTDNTSDPCLMKLFDRTVDLAPFSEDTPLYPICRAWIRNQHYPSLPDRAGQNTENDGAIGGPVVFELPEPAIVKSENGEEVYPSIPSPIKQEGETFFINQDSNPVEPETLFLNHMVRWKRVRQKWKKASRNNELRYIESYNVIRNMFDKFSREVQ